MEKKWGWVEEVRSVHLKRSIGGGGSPTLEEGSVGHLNPSFLLERRAVWARWEY